MRTLTATSLENAALHHLERHPSTEKHLVRILRRKAEAWARKKDLPVPAEADAWIAAVVAKLVGAGYVDDARLAAAKVRQLRSRGKSTRAIENALRQKGVPADVIAGVTAPPQGPNGGAGGLDPDEAAAWALARRKKLGPYGDAATRGERKQKDLAVLGRAGFSFLVARRVVDSDEPR